MQPHQGQVGAVHDIEAARFRKQQVQGVHVVHLAIAHMDEAGYGAAQVHEGVQLHGGLGPAELRPREGREAQVDGGGIQRVDRLLQIQYAGLAGVEAAGLADEHLCEVRVDPPVVQFVRIGQRTALHRAAQPHAIELAGLCAQAEFDVPKAPSVCELREGHRSEVLPAGERSHVVVPAITPHDPVERRPWKMSHQLAVYSASFVHACFLVLPSRKPSPGDRPDSNPPHAFSACNPRPCWNYPVITTHLTGHYWEAVSNTGPATSPSRQASGVPAGSDLRI